MDDELSKVMSAGYTAAQKHKLVLKSWKMQHKQSTRTGEMTIYYDTPKTRCK